MAYEALSWGRPVIMYDCLFSRCLKQNYPSLVVIIDSITDLKKLELGGESSSRESLQFLECHSARYISDQLSHIVGQL